jgi:hypothetical protein
MGNNHTHAPHPPTPAQKLTRSMSAFAYADMPKNLQPYAPSLSQCEGQYCVFNHLYANNSLQFEQLHKQGKHQSIIEVDEEESNGTDGNILALLQSYRPKGTTNKFDE